MSSYEIKNNKILLPILTAIMIGFLSANNPAFSQILDMKFDLNPDFYPEKNNYQQYIDESDVYYKRGLAFLDSNQYSKAVDSFEKALNLTPDRVNTRINLAAAYINRGTYFYNQLKDTNKALNDYRNALFLLKYDTNLPASSSAYTENLGIAKSNIESILKDAKISTAKSSRLKMAKELRGQGKFREALVEYYEALEGNQTDLPVYIAIADLSSILKNDKNAVKYYQKAVAHNQNNVDLHLKLARAMHNSGEVDNAIKEYNVALKTAKNNEKTEVLDELERVWVKKLQENPHDAVAHMNLGVILQKKGDFEEALKEYQFAEAINPSDITTRLNMGTLYHAMKNYDTAIKAYDTILHVEPNNLLAHYYRGKALKDIGELDSAVHEFQFVLKRDADNIEAKEALYDTIKQFPDRHEVTEIFKTFAINNPTDAFAQYKYAYRLHSMKKYDEAIEYYRKTIALDPKYTDAYLNIAIVYKEKNLPSNAVSALQYGLKSLPDNKKIKEMLASLSTETATSRYENALKKHNQGKYEEAIKEYLSIIQVSEPDTDLYVNLGAAYQASKKLNEAANAYIKASQIDSKNSTAFYYLGTVYAAQGKHQEAVKAYQKALALDSSNDDIKQALAVSNQAVKESALQKGINEYNKGKYNEALLTFNSLAIKDPNNGYIYYYRGMVYDALKKYQLAIADYKLAVRYNSDLTYSYYAVAVDYDTLKNYPEAKKWYKFFIEKSTDTADQYVKYAKDRIKQI